jgi:hypothetical protein
MQPICSPVKFPVSAKSDAHELLIANTLQSLLGEDNARRPPTDVHHSDVQFRLNRDMPFFWLEVKMAPTDNFCNLRFSYQESNWQCSNEGKIAETIVDELNTSEETLQFINGISQFSGIATEELKLRGSRKPDPKNLPLHVMKSYVKSLPNQYIMNLPDYDLGKAVTLHYHSKAEPVYHLQAGDNFYLFGNTNPLGLKGVPEVQAKGDLRVRVSTRSKMFEIQTEVKLNLKESEWSLLPNTSKRNPLLERLGSR